MYLCATLALAAALASGSNLPAANGSRAAQSQAPASKPSGRAPGASASSPAAHQATGPSGPITPQSKLLLIRNVDGEYAKAVRPIPGKKKGFRILVGKPVDPQSLSDALRLWGTAANPGDTVQVTGVDFRSHDILVQINGGGKRHFHWLQHLQISAGPMDPVAPPETPLEDRTGGTLLLDYGHTLPNLTPEDVKRDLSAFLDFSKQHSATVNWVETLPPQYRQAVQDHRAVVGMDQEMVIAALGRPDKKVREKDAQGRETEDWIYNLPPARTTFVTFVGDTVVRVKESG